MYWGRMTVDQAGRILPILTGKLVSSLIPELEYRSGCRKVLGEKGVQRWDVSMSSI